MKRNYLLLIVALLGIMLIAASVSAQNAKYKVGDQVEADTVGNGAWYPAKIVEVKDGQYKIRLEMNGMTYDVAEDKVRAALKPKYKEGDRVEINMVPGPGDKSQAVWKKGTIITVNLAGLSYWIQLDPIPGSGSAPRELGIPMSRELSGDIRPFAGAAPQIITEKIRVDENGTVLADREIMDCENLKHNGRNGTPLPVELAKKLIRCLYEKPAKPGEDGATTMDITEFTVGAPHRWRVYIDIGQGEPNTLVYPVQVQWNMKTFYHTRNLQTTGQEAPFTCFADATNIWQCGGSSGSKKAGKTQEILVKQ
jgi:hypothetical protein